MTAITTEIQGYLAGKDLDNLIGIPRQRYLLSDANGLTDTDQLQDPAGNDVTARRIITTVAGTIYTTDIEGNTVPNILKVGGEILGFTNGVRSTGAVTITAADLIIET